MMMLTRDEIESILAASVGNPDSGAVRDVLPTLADAVAAALNPSKPTDEQRVIKPAETR